MVSTGASKSQSASRRKLVRARGKINPGHFGIDIERDAFTDLLVEYFAAAYSDSWFVDEPLPHGHEATRFRDEIHRQRIDFDLPDNGIPRAGHEVESFDRFPDACATLNQGVNKDPDSGYRAQDVAELHKRCICDQQRRKHDASP